MGSFSEAAEGLAPETEELRALVRRLERRLATAKAKREDLVEAVYQAARDAAVTVGPPPKIPTPRRDRRSKAEEVALLHVSDWQIGKRTITYNSDVAAERLALLPDKVEELTELQRAARPIRKCVLFLGGDMVEGTGIFPGQVWEVDSTLYGQFFHTVHLIVGLVRRLLAIFEEVEVWDEAGNHGRVAKDSPDNYDRMVYRVARDQLAGERRLTWNHSTHWHTIPQIGAYRPLLAHGDEVRSYGGNLPSYGIVKKVTAWASGVIEPFHDAYMGHFHTPMVLVVPNGRRVFINGTIESDNQYAKEFVAATGLPCQRLNFVDPRKGRVTAEQLVWLD